MKHDDFLDKLKKAQGAEEDIRENSRECVDFVDKRDGQWEPDIVQKFSGKPRYTDDKVSPVVNQISGEMSQSEFTVRCRPAGGQASKEIARIYDGIIRSIRNRSNAEQTFKQAARQMLKGGIAGWEIESDYADGDTFDQELLIRRLDNYEQRVWIDPFSLEQDNSDARWGVILDYISKSEYKDKFPKGKMRSLGDVSHHDNYAHKPDYITIGKAYYRKPKKMELVLMSNGAVYEDDEDFQKVKDELEQAGIVEENRRTKESYRFYCRYFDQSGWLDKEEETVFNYLPIITVYGNYSVSEGKRLYYGIVEKLMDQQRVHNYAFSREVEEVALAPRAKYWMTMKQAEGHEAKLASLNTNMDPIQFFNPDPENPGAPQQNGGAQINPALRAIVDSTSVAINSSAGQFAANLGDNPGLQSGKAIQEQVDRGNNGTAGYFDAMAIAIQYTGRVLVDAIPRVYDATRQVRVLQEDGAHEIITINQPIIDQQSGETVYLNDLTQGDYDVICDMGATYKNRQAEAAEYFAKIASVDPAVMELGRDIWFKSIEAPGMDDLALRARQAMVGQGIIPQEQMTQEELQQLQMAQQQPPQPDPMMVAAEAEMMKAQAEMLAQQNKHQEIQLKAVDIQARAQGQADKLQSETALNMAKVQQGDRKLDMDAQKLLTDMALRLTELEQKYEAQLNAQYIENARLTPNQQL